MKNAIIVIHGKTLVIFDEILEKALKYYYIVGGMPEVVAKWVETHNFEKIEKLQDNILQDYSSDFAKHAPKTDIPKLGWIWDSIPKQLAKDNNKFVFSHVKAGKRSSELEWRMHLSGWSMQALCINWNWS